MTIEPLANPINGHTGLVAVSAYYKIPLLGQGLLIIEDSRLHSGTPQSVGFPRISDQLHSEIFT